MMTSGALSALIAWPLVVLDSAALLPALSDHRLATAALACSLLGGAALSIVRSQFFARILATAGAAIVLAALGPAWLKNPAVTLLVGIVLVSSLVWLWSPKLEWLGISGLPLLGGSGYLRGAIVAALFAWSYWVFTGADDNPGSLVPVVWAGAVAATFGFWRVIRRAPGEPLRSLTLFCVYATSGVAIWFWWQKPHVVAGLPVLAAVLVGFTLRRKRTGTVERGSFWEPLLGHPERLFVGTFAFFCIIGSASLSLPAASAHESGLDYVDALFTATSAVCVTGLSTIDPSRDLTVFGQALVLVLIQVGGLGIMTFSTVLLWALGRRMSLRHEGAVATLLSPRDRGRLFESARQIIAFTILSELAGTLALAWLFWREGDRFGLALWRGLFTSISAFCNAGFAIQSTSLVPYQNSPLILHSIALLIILGGISPIAAFALPSILRRSVKPVAVQAKLALIAALLLCVTGFALFLAFEWSGTLHGLSTVNKLHNAWFQSVTLRTAGFNSVDLTLIQPATFTVMILWMFIGGSPGSTAGGVKTTTISILLLSVMQTIRGQISLEVFGRTIPEKTKTRAVAVTFIAASTGLLALLALQLTQDMSEREAWFETFSALGTVGLTIGGTARLDGVGKVIIITCMFIGRVGGLTLLMFLNSRSFVPKIGRPIEEVDVG